MNVLLRHRRIVLGLPLAVALLVVTFILLLPRSYTADAAFLPEVTERVPSGLTGLAAQFGFTYSGGRGSETPEFYADLLRSRELLRATVETRFDLDARSGGRGTLVDYYRLDDENREISVAKAVDRLRDDVTVRTRPETGVVRLAVETRSPLLSEQIATRMLTLVNEFNLERRQSRAAAERDFIEGRLQEVESELQAAEDSLQAFLQRNRRYENSPELVFEFERLQRRVGLRQQVFTALSQSFEEARIEEVRNTPVITIVDPPEAPARPDRRYVLLKGILGLFLGGMVGVFWAFGREFHTRSRTEDPGEYADFERLRSETVRDVRGAWQRLRPGAGSRSGDQE